MLKRLLSALVLLPFVVFLVWAGTLWCALLVAFCGGIAALEFYSMVAKSKAKPFTYFGVALSVFLIMSPYLSQDFFLPIILTIATALPLIYLLFQREKEDVFSRWVWTLAGIIYIGWLFSYLVAIRGGFSPLRFGENTGRSWAFYTLFVSFASDSMAYFVGVSTGRHHLAPYVSPHKTWEGAAGGLIGGIIISLLFKLPTPVSLPINVFEAVILGAIVSIFTQLGDLVKSLIKRNMGVKDSGNLIPGHGGFLDRIDSLLFASVLIYYYLLIVA